MNMRSLCLTIAVTVALISATSQAVGWTIIYPNEPGPKPPPPPPYDLGMVVIYYAGETSPANWVRSTLTTSYNDVSSGHHFSNGYFMCSTADATHGLGWVDNTSTYKITIARTIYGDADLNGTVGLSDLGKVLTYWGVGTNWGDGDVDYNAAVGLSDLGKVLTNWGLSVGSLTPAANTQAVPEPAGIWLMAITAVSLAAYAARRRL